MDKQKPEQTGADPAEDATKTAESTEQVAGSADEAKTEETQSTDEAKAEETGGDNGDD